MQYGNTYNRVERIHGGVLCQLRENVKWLIERTKENGRRIDDMERREEEMCRMAGMWEERSVDFRRIWEEALGWERAARAKEGEGGVIGIISRGGQEEGGSLGSEGAQDSELGDAVTTMKRDTSYFSHPPGHICC